MITVQRQRTLYRDERFHAAFPSIVRFSDDALLLAFRRARSGLWLISRQRRDALENQRRMDHMDCRSQLLLMELDGDGHPNGAALDGVPIDPEAADQDPSLIVLPEDQVLLLSFSWYPLPSDVSGEFVGREPPGERELGCRYLPWGSHSSLRTRDAGRWLAHHRYLDPGGGPGGLLGAERQRRYVGPIRGRPAMVDDEVLVAAYGQVLGGCELYASRDAGGSWQWRGTIATNVADETAFQEPALCEDGNGGLICFMRTAGAGGRLATCRSSDGVKWDQVRLHEVYGQPFHPLPLADGRILLCYGFRGKPYGVRVRLLEHALAEPALAQEVVLRADGLGPDLGYPWAVQLRDGRVLVVYYWTDADGVRSIQGCWLKLAA